MLKKLPDHPIAEAFPMADPVDRAAMLESLRKNGQIEAIFTLDGMVLDGRNRQELLIDELKIAPVYEDWKDLPPNLTKNGPLEFVKARNFDRRHLTKSQRAAVGALLAIMFEKEEAAAKAAGKPAASPRGDEFSQETEHAPEDESQARGGKRSAKGRSSQRAAKIVGVSARSIQRAVSVAKKDPKALEEIEAGRGTVGGAEKKITKAEKAKTDLEDALKRIENIGGKAFAEVMRGRKTAEVLELSALKDDDILKVRGLVTNGWPVKKAKHYKMTALSRTHTIGDLLVRAISKGVSGKFPFTLEINYDDQKYDITVLKKE